MKSQLFRCQRRWWGGLILVIIAAGLVPVGPAAGAAASQSKGKSVAKSSSSQSKSATKSSSPQGKAASSKLSQSASKASSSAPQSKASRVAQSSRSTSQTTKSSSSAVQSAGKSLTSSVGKSSTSSSGKSAVTQTFSTRSSSTGLGRVLGSGSNSSSAGSRRSNSISGAVGSGAGSSQARRSAVQSTARSTTSSGLTTRTNSVGAGAVGTGGSRISGLSSSISTTANASTTSRSTTNSRSTTTSAPPVRANARNTIQPQTQAGTSGSLPNRSIWSTGPVSRLTGATRPETTAPPNTLNINRTQRNMSAAQRSNEPTNGNKISVAALAAAQREQASMQRRAPKPTVTVVDNRSSLLSRALFVESMRRSLGRFAPRPAVYHETNIIHHETNVINPPPVVIVGSATAPYEDYYYDEAGYPPEEYYGGYYLDTDYLNAFGYAYDEQGNLYICPQEGYYAPAAPYVTRAGYIQPPAYLVGPGIEYESYYYPGGAFYSGYGRSGYLNYLLRSYLTPYSYHRANYYWSRFSNMAQSGSRYKMLLPLFLTTVL